MGGFKEYDKYDALGLAELVRKKKVSPVELCEEAIDRIEKLNPKLNAVIHKLYDQALSLLNNAPSKELKDKCCERLMLEAEICFRKQDFNRIFEIISEIKNHKDELSEADKHIISFWLGHK